jgi:hypothetical protein
MIALLHRLLSYGTQVSSLRLSKCWCSWRQGFVWVVYSWFTLLISYVPYSIIYVRKILHTVPFASSTSNAMYGIWGTHIPYLYHMCMSHLLSTVRCAALQYRSHQSLLSLSHFAMLDIDIKCHSVDLWFGFLYRISGCVTWKMIFKVQYMIV